MIVHGRPQELGRSAITRPALRYHGGKWVLAPWIIANMPPHQIYVEPFGGGASVLLRKARAYAEVYNDIHGEVVNLFRVLRDHGAELRRRAELTPFSREEYRASFGYASDPIERARHLLVRSFMGFGSNSVNRVVNSGFRGKSKRSGTTPAHDWMHFPDALQAITARLRGVVIENRPAADVIASNDGDDVLFYCDPPYVAETRTRGAGRGARAGYVHEMADNDHRDLAEVLRSVQGMVMLSGYRCTMYDQLYAEWHRLDHKALADGARERTESLWLNPAAQERFGLFAAGMAAGGAV